MKQSGSRRESSLSANMPIIGKRRRDDEASDSGRKKGTQSRVGRACDRCQHRKLACDPTKHSCQQCQKANTWCTNTDLLSGIPAYRGEYEYLERKIEKQSSDIQELLQRLRSLGQDPIGFEVEDNEGIRYAAWKNARMIEPNRPWEREDGQANYTKDLVMQDQSQYSPSLSFRSQSYNGGSPTYSPPPSSGRYAYTPQPMLGLPYDTHETQTSRSITPLGWNVELQDMANGSAYPMDGTMPIYNPSYSTFIPTTTQGPPELLPPADIPASQIIGEYSEEYLRLRGGYIPVLHD